MNGKQCSTRSAMPSFKEAKEALMVVINRLAEFFERRGREQMAERARGLARKLAREQFNLVVLGQFKRGKSTLINAILGAPVLPTAVVPLTSIVTIIRYGPRPRAIVHMLNGNEMEIDLAELAQYITERGNPNNFKGVAQVEVFFPSEFLRSGAALVDTPGVGSVFANNTGVTYDYLPEADAAIFLLAADQPISQAELDFLHRARRHAAKFFFVLNKIDYLSESELEESISFNASVISESIGQDVTIHPVCARAALCGRIEQSRLPELEQQLSEFLLREKAIRLLDVICNRARALASEALSAMELEQSAIQMPARLLAERIEAFHKKAAEIAEQRSDTQYLLRGEIGALISAIEADLRPFVDEAVVVLKGHISQAFERNQHLSKGELVKVMNEEMARRVEAIFAPWREEQERRIRASFDRITSRFAERANQVMREVQDLTAKLFGARAQLFIEVEPFTTESSHYYYTENPFALQLSALPLLLPGPLAKRFIRKQFIDSCREELDRNAGRLRADFQERLEKSASRFKASFDQKVKAALDGLEQTLRRAAEEKRRSDFELAAAQMALEADRNALSQIIALIDFRALN
jgi:GTP-binding protein EngB required for normal cell division